MRSRHTPLVLAALVLVPAAASAQGTDADRASARLLAEQGLQALDARDYATAADRFARAFALVRAPTLELGLARADVGLGRWIAALDLYSRILNEGVAPGSPGAFYDALNDARRELAALGPRVPRIIIRVEGAAASVTIDGVAVPSAALGVTRPVDPGTHVIRAEGAGVAPAQVEVTMAFGTLETVTLKLQPPAATPPAPLAAPPGAAAQSGGPGTTQRRVAFAALGLGGAGLVVGAVAGGIAVADHGKLAAACPDQHRCTSPELGGYGAAGAASTAGFVAGAALAATGGVLLIVAPAAQGNTAVRVTGVLGSGWAGVRGRF